ncbi:MAG: exodeoxyribonuclease III, partial [Myxococcaceae bacterium]|nr:exodeoxyribonuclease III [Myxococcaceae bacterium]
MKLTTWNVNGLRAREGQVVEWLQREQPDVLCLQEIKASREQVPPHLWALDGYHCAWHGGPGGYSGVAVLVRRALVPQRPVFRHPSYDHESRAITLELGPLDITALYVPNGGKDLPAKIRFLEALRADVAQRLRDGKQLIVCGDLNVALTERDVHPKLAKATQLGQTVQERALLSGVLGEGLVDLERRLHPDDDQRFTWWAPWRQQREQNMGWRIDYVLASAALAPKVTACGADRLFGSSDHGPLTAVFDGLEVDAAAVPQGPAQEP